MRILGLLLILGFSLLAAARLQAHGAIWRPPPGMTSGPTDVVAPPTPLTPGNSVPQPLAPNPASPVTPSSPGGVRVAGAPSAPTATTGGELPADVASWELWWDYNRDRYLGLRTLPNRGQAITSSGYAQSTGTTKPKEASRKRVREAAHQRLEHPRATTGEISAALIALARTARHPSEAERVLQHLHSRNQEIAETAVLALGLLRAPHLLSPLESLLRDQPEGARLCGRERVALRTREFAAYALALAVEDARLESFRERAAEALLSVAGDGQQPASLAGACLIALAQIPLREPGPALKKLRSWLENDRLSASVRAHVPTCVARMLHAMPSPPEELVASWSQLLSERVEIPAEAVAVRQACVHAFGWLPLKEAQEASIAEILIRLSKEDADSLIRNQSLLSLALLARSNRSTTQTHVLPHLLQRLDQGGFHARGWAALALGVLGYEARARGQELPSLVARRLHQRFQEENSPSVRSACAIGLGLMQHRSAAKDLLAVLEDRKNPDLQARLAVGLGLLAEEGARAPLRELLNRSMRKPELLRHVGEALVLLADREAQSDLVTRLAQGSKHSLATTLALAQALAAMRSRDALEPLQSVVTDMDRQPLARALALAAMGWIADPAERPFRAVFAQALNYRLAPATLVDSAGLSGLLNLL